MSNRGNNEELSKSVSPPNTEMEETQEESTQDTENLSLPPPSNAHRKSSFRSSGGANGPPPRPFKKARYAWEIKNYEHTLENMSRGDMSRDDDITGEGGSNAMDISDMLQRQQCLKNMGLMDYQSRQSMLSPSMIPAPYPSPYGLIGNPNPHSMPINDIDGHHHHHHHHHRPPMMPQQDPDAGLFRWHTRQLCRSIFDNTVNRMLENMGFSPVTEQSQGIHPLLVLSLSDEEEREAEEAQHRALETEALTAAMHQKGLLVPSYNYDNVESGTTTDYDSSEDDSELGEDGVVTDELSPSDVNHHNHHNNHHHHNHHHHHHHHNHHQHHFINRPVPVRLPNCVNYVPECQNNLNEKAVINSKHSEINYNEEHKSESNKDESPTDEQEQDEESNKDVDNDCGSPNSITCNNTVDQDQDISDVDATSVTPVLSPQVRVDANENCIGMIDEMSAIDVKKTEERLKDNIPEKIKRETEGNNNDKFFLDQAIQMAIKQQGLGYQQA